MDGCIGCLYNLFKIVFFGGLAWIIFHIITPDGAESEFFLLFLFLFAVVMAALVYSIKKDQK